MLRALTAAVTPLVLLLASAATGSSQSTTVLLAYGRTEPILAVDPRRPSTIVVGSNTNYNAPVNGTLPVEVFSSADGGRRFVAAPMPVLRPFTIGADPDVAIDRNGTVYYSYLGEAPTYCSSGPSAILVTRSIDGGRSFRPLVPVDRNTNDDKPWMAVESVARRPSHIYLVWTRWHQRSSDIWYSRSTDGGVRFSVPMRLYSSGQNNTGAQPVVGPGGRVYVLWARSADVGATRSAQTTLLVRASSNDGARFGGVRRVAGPFPGVPRMSQPASLRNITFPSAAVTSRGVLAVSWPQVRDDFGEGRTRDDILVASSSGDGSRWSRPRRVNDTAVGDRFMPALAPLPDGRMAVSFYDRRAGPGTLRVFAATVTFGAGTRVSRNVRVDIGTSHVSDIFYLAPGSTCFSPGRFFGDYMGLSACGRDLCAVWTDTARGVPNETDIWFRRLPIPGSGGTGGTRVNSRVQFLCPPSLPR